MVSGLLVPVVMMLLIKKPSPLAALVAMIIGGGTTLILTLGTWVPSYGLDPIVFGLVAALVSYVTVQFIDRL
jgi:SSS family solute:Na+ symporter